ncbi:MAG TPA: cytochrome c-type biogenesis CcmF C-terminal domain-containing protein, partial [Bryobacteraceae bacterium]
GHAFDLRQTRSLGLNENLRFGHYDLKLLSVTSGDNPNYESSRAFIDVSQNGHVMDQLTPEIRLYKSSQEQSSIIAIRRRLNEDLYINFSGIAPDNTKAIFQMSILPLVAWIWIGYFVVLAGTIVCLIPPKVRLQYARTEIVGYASAPATVQP